MYISEWLVQDKLIHTYIHINIYILLKVDYFSWNLQLSCRNVIEEIQITIHKYYTKLVINTLSMLKTKAQVNESPPFFDLVFPFCGSQSLSFFYTYYTSNS